ncbi:molybdopterin synthase catalytic subunit [Campylobacter geochelonis]|uniref:molybdopterin synthase catalytic subunit n=1 Tax=Campylobacter geochelonis TaxID=1780362 RepID=UPI000770AAFF|nr:molybdenum cofactor biosynthesis protein MoaE [Campylobacter geochelonis]CZE45758.1 molybdopterin converting factor%2C subunit 2 [Campylobacter geochelonis]
MSLEQEIEIYNGSLNTVEIYKKWYEIYQYKNCGALITFTGIVREESGISALSFDIHKPLLQSWFEGWIQKAKKQNAYVLFAHANGDVAVHESSYIAGVVSPQRKVALRLINEFVEDFKANAPIWKYDVIEGKRIYAKNRSQKLAGAGILS